MKQLELLVVMVITGEQMIGYGLDISVDDKETSHNNHHDEDPDFHPLPPPITKGICCQSNQGWLSRSSKSIYGCYYYPYIDTTIIHIWTLLLTIYRCYY